MGDQAKSGTVENSRGPQTCQMPTGLWDGGRGMWMMARRSEVSWFCADGQSVCHSADGMQRHGRDTLTRKNIGCYNNHYKYRPG